MLLHVCQVFHELSDLDSLRLPGLKEYELCQLAELGDVGSINLLPIFLLECGGSLKVSLDLLCLQLDLHGRLDVVGELLTDKI